jgi:hypothetical protein
VLSAQRRQLLEPRGLFGPDATQHRLLLLGRPTGAGRASSLVGPPLTGVTVAIKHQTIVTPVYCGLVSGCM